MTKFTMTEIESEHVELLPSKETMFVFHVGNNNYASIVASNSSLALNAASLLASANSAAVQTIVVGQG